MDLGIFGLKLQFCKFFLSHNSQKRFGNKENNTKYGSLNSNVVAISYMERGHLPIYWPVLSQSECSRFLGHIITYVISNFHTDSINGRMAKSRLKVLAII